MKIIKLLLIALYCKLLSLNEKQNFYKGWKKKDTENYLKSTYHKENGHCSLCLSDNTATETNHMA